MKATYRVEVTTKGKRYKGNFRYPKVAFRNARKTLQTEPAPTRVLIWRETDTKLYLMADLQTEGTNATQDKAKHASTRQGTTAKRKPSRGKRPASKASARPQSP
jgi:hypothetical protein